MLSVVVLLPMSNSGEIFSRFVEVVRALRDPEKGCPWDLEQDHRSLRPYVVEETYEVLEAIDSGNDSELANELGDLLLQVVLHAQVATDRGAFGIDQVVEEITAKMIRRHPHVFGDVKVNSSDEVLTNWEALKLEERRKEKHHSGAAPSVLDGVPTALPSLLRAQRLGHKAAKVGFDWNDLSGVLSKVHEELAELKTELGPTNPQTERNKIDLSSANKQRIEAELGDLLFALCQLARWLGVSAEDSLREGAERFINRFQTMERGSPRPLNELSLDELDSLWTAAKSSSSPK